MTSLTYERSALLSSSHGFFGREGGVSKGSFASLNGSFRSGDDEDAVRENRRRMAEAMAVDAITTPKQTHSPIALYTSEPLDLENLPEADALVTDVPRLAVGVQTADCTPLLFEAQGLVAAAHAGWRGSMRGVIGSTIDLMEERGAERSAIKVAIGPCLRGPSFEVRQDLIDDVMAAHPDSGRFFTPFNDEQSLYDHIGFVRTQLREAGIAEDHIDDIGGDTLGDQRRYFSYRGARAAGLLQFGHNLSAIALSL